MTPTEPTGSAWGFVDGSGSGWFTSQILLPRTASSIDGLRVLSTWSFVLGPYRVPGSRCKCLVLRQVLGSWFLSREDGANRARAPLHERQSFRGSQGVAGGQTPIRRCWRAASESELSARPQAAGPTQCSLFVDGAQHRRRLRAPRPQRVRPSCPDRGSVERRDSRGAVLGARSKATECRSAGPAHRANGVDRPHAPTPRATPLLITAGTSPRARALDHRPGPWTSDLPPDQEPDRAPRT
jgi:hypothetical protein